MAERKNKAFPHKSNRKNFSGSHIHRKRPASKFSNDENVIYVNSKTHIKAFLQRCNKLVEKNQEEIIIYCLGASIPKGILLALQVCERHASYKLHTNTLTTVVVDDFEPIVDDADYEMQTRNKSGLQIKLYNTDTLKPEEEIK
ncbi:hypothetical protein WA026_001496 [Henosepilachna vigintioctopunctata]|uniref:Uncharacterized protein n=1 Tax=Henosepilachna vigintioctopunctata TaxID=420089 RepID=A0AAW1UIA4_9CUCU